MEHVLIRHRLINCEKITEDDYKLIYFFLSRVFKDEPANVENVDEDEKKKNLEIKNIYEMINGDFPEYVEEGGKALSYIIRYLKNSKISGQDVLGYNQIVNTNDISSQRVSATLSYLTKEKLLDKVIHDKKSYFSISNSFDVNLKKICDRINVYINAYNLMPFSDDDLYSNEDELEDETEQDFEKEVMSLTRKYKTQEKEYDSSEIISDKKKLVEYMKNIVEVESDIYSLKQRYISLEMKKQHYMSYLIKDSYTVCLDFSNEIRKIDDEIKSSNYIDEKPTLDYFLSINTINKPIFKSQKPVEPVLKKVGLFNKKKIEQENNEILLDYKNKLAEYEKEKIEYDILIKQYEEEKQRMNIKANEQYRIAMQQYEDKINEIHKEINNKKLQKENMIANSEKLINELLLNNKYYQKIKAIDYEKDYIEKCIEEPIKLKEEIYSYNIIYGKYRNFIAISSFIDYFMSGRCDSLEGSDGAYNLYEQETRTDIIINKMEVIIKKLDQIANNQYYMYNKLNEINDSLYNISGQLMVNNILQTIQVSELEKIIDKADKIAYNTEVTAYYAEKTSKYTKIMTYLNFLNLRA